MVELKKLDIKSVAIISLILFSIIGLVIAIPFGLISMFAASFSGMNPFSGIFGLSFIIIMPIFYGAIGTIFNVIIAFIYNLIAEKVGGLKFRLVNIKNNVNRFAEVKPVQELNNLS